MLSSDLLLHGLSHTTIGAGTFHFRVRDGIGWGHAAIAAEQLVKTALRAPVLHREGRNKRMCVETNRIEASWSYMVKPHGSLVSVS